MSKIEWTDRTHNVTIGCTPQSAGCKHCYAEAFAPRVHNLPSYQGVLRRKGTRLRWSGRVNLVPQRLPPILRWRKPQRVFINSMSDLWHPAIPNDYIAACYATFTMTPHVDFQLLTKQHRRLVQWFRWLVDQRNPSAVMQRAIQTYWPPGEPLPDVEGVPLPAPNIWVGVSTEDDTMLRQRWSALMQVPAAVRFLSIEPLLATLPSFDPSAFVDVSGRLVDWAILGGESTRGARPFDADEGLRVLGLVIDHGIHGFVKQLGRRPVYRGEHLRLHDSKGGDMSEFPLPLRVREFPRPRGHAIGVAA